MATPTQSNLRFAGPEDAKLVFFGPPSGVRGRIPLHNPTDERQRLRTLTVSATDLLGPAQLPLREFPVAVRLRPGEQISVPATIPLDARTKPGTYELILNVAGREVPATVYVSEVVDLRVQPDNVTLLVGAKRSYTRVFTVENAGNVPLPMGAHCETPLFDAVDIGATVLVGLAKASEKELGEKIAAALDELGDAVAGTISVDRDRTILAPGQMLAGPVEFTLPHNLKPQHHYHANLQLHGASVRVDVYTTEKAGREREKERDPERELERDKNKEPRRRG